MLDPDCEVDAIEDIDEGDCLLIKGQVYYIMISHKGLTGQPCLILVTYCENEFSKTLLFVTVIPKNASKKDKNLQGSPPGVLQGCWDS